MRLSVMVSSTIYTNHSSSFSTAKLFEETGSALESLPWLALKGLAFWLAWFKVQVLERSCSSLSQSNNCFKLGLIQMLMHWMNLRWRSRMVMIWYFDNKSPLSINTFLSYISNGQLLSLDDVCLLFSAIGCYWTSWYFPPESHLIVIFFSLFEFLVATV